MTIGVMCLIAAGQGSPAAAQDAAACDRAITAAQLRHRLPPTLLGGIARVESGRRLGDGHVVPWPWSINADGRGLFRLSRADAVATTAALLGRGARRVDVGCLQIDLQEHPGAFASLEEAFDPDRNAEAAARFLIWLHDGPAGRDWATAAGFFHSRTPGLAEAYRGRLLAILTNRARAVVWRPHAAPTSR